MKKNLKNIYNKVKSILIYIIRLITIFATLYLFRFLGFKGFFGLILGLFIMAWLLLSNNQLLIYFVNLFTQENYTSVLKFEGLKENEKRNNKK